MPSPPLYFRRSAKGILSRYARDGRVGTPRCVGESLPFADPPCGAEGLFLSFQFHQEMPGKPLGRTPEIGLHHAIHRGRLKGFTANRSAWTCTNPNSNVQTLEPDRFWFGWVCKSGSRHFSSTGLDVDLNAGPSFGHFQFDVLTSYGLIQFKKPDGVAAYDKNVVAPRVLLGYHLGH